MFLKIFQDFLRYSRIFQKKIEIFSDVKDTSESRMYRDISGIPSNATGFLMPDHCAISLHSLSLKQLLFLSEIKLF